MASYRRGSRQSQTTRGGGHPTSRKRTTGRGHPTAGNTSRKRVSGGGHPTSRKRTAGGGHPTAGKPPRKRVSGGGHPTSRKRTAGGGHPTSQKRSAGTTTRRPSRPSSGTRRSGPASKSNEAAYKRFMAMTPAQRKYVISMSRPMTSNKVATKKPARRRGGSGNAR